MSQWYIEHQSQAERHAIRIDHTVYRGRTRYQSVRIVDTEAYGRILILDRDIQSAQLDEGTYHEILVHPAMMAHPAPKKVLIMGGGEGATLREILRYRSVEKVVMVDLDGQLVELCKTYLPTWSQGSFDDPRLEYLADDARAYVDRTQEKFDVVIHDLPQPVLEGETRAELIRLFSKECFTAIARCLTPTGVIGMQACSARTRTDPIFRVIVRTLSQVFPIVAPIHVYIPSFANDWGFLVGSLGADPRHLSASDVTRRQTDQWTPGHQCQYYSPTIHTTLFTFSPNRPEPVPAHAILEDGKLFPSI